MLQPDSWQIFESPFGAFVLGFNSARKLQFSMPRVCCNFELPVHKRLDSIETEECKKEFRAYFSGGTRSFTTSFELKGTPFQEEIWDYLTTIPYGSTQTYLEVAQAVGAPKAVRAVGNAIGTNPLLVIIPCHRVIRSNGELGGYRGSIAMKAALLTLEQQNNKVS